MLQDGSDSHRRETKLVVEVIDAIPQREVDTVILSPIRPNILPHRVSSNVGARGDGSEVAVVGTGQDL